MSKGILQKEMEDGCQSKECKCGTEIHWIGKIPVETRHRHIIVTESGNVEKGYVSHYERCSFAKEFRQHAAVISLTPLLPGMDKSTKEGQ